MLAPHEPGLRVALGISGSGKTHGMRTDVLRAACLYPVCVLDFVEEWTSVPEEFAAYTRGATTWGPVNGSPGAKAFLEQGARIVIFRPPAIEGSWDTATDAVCQWAYERRAPCGIAIPEAHNVAPIGRMPQLLRQVATAWRHRQVSLWCDSQRLAALNHAVTENARELRVYAHVGDSDLKRLREISRGLDDAALECARRMDKRDRGGDDEPGWHAVLGLIRKPPHGQSWSDVLTREA